jgi:hypothetical protein
MDSQLLGGAVLTRKPKTELMKMKLHRTWMREWLG